MQVEKNRWTEWKKLCVWRRLVCFNREQFALGWVYLKLFLKLNYRHRIDCVVFCRIKIWVKEEMKCNVASGHLPLDTIDSRSAIPSFGITLIWFSIFLTHSHIQLFSELKLCGVIDASSKFSYALILSKQARILIFCVFSLYIWIKISLLLTKPEYFG